MKRLRHCQVNRVNHSSDLLLVSSCKWPSVIAESNVEHLLCFNCLLVFVMVDCMIFNYFFYWNSKSLLSFDLYCQNYKYCQTRNWWASSTRKPSVNVFCWRDDKLWHGFFFLLDGLFLTCYTSQSVVAQPGTYHVWKASSTGNMFPSIFYHLSGSLRQQCKQSRAPRAPAPQPPPPGLQGRRHSQACWKLWFPPACHGTAPGSQNTSPRRNPGSILDRKPNQLSC